MATVELWNFFVKKVYDGLCINMSKGQTKIKRYFVIHNTVTLGYTS